MSKVLLAIAWAAVIAATFAPTEASARHRHRVVVIRHVGGMVGWSAADFCGGRLPAYGTDACGNREFSYGPGSCWARAVRYTPLGPVARRVWACGRPGPMA
jgi:hypothetical protein